MALTREELAYWSKQGLDEKGWAHLRLMSHLDGDEKIAKEKALLDSRIKNES